MKSAGEVHIGDVVEFEPGLPVLVLSIENNYDETNRYQDSDYSRKVYGESLVFGCNYSDVNDPEVAARVGENTFYVRRERSPISGQVVR